MDGLMLEDEYCGKLGLNHMDASAQIPAREYLADVIYVLARNAETMGNLANYIRTGRGDDAGIFKFPRKKKGSTAMPHKDAKGGNPSVEEQTESSANYMRGALGTSLSSCKFDYARDLSGSASDRIIFEDAFNWGDFVVRRLANIVYKLEPVEERCKERVYRSYGAPTAQWVMNYVTDKTKTNNPLPRSEAHDIIAKLATEAYVSKVQFRDVVLNCPDINSRLDRDTIIKITDPTNYIGRSKDIIERVYNKYHGKKTLV
jgi:adenylosuccinate lyase